MAWHGMVFYGMSWHGYGMVGVWHGSGMVWHGGMAWHGMVEVWHGMSW